MHARSSGETRRWPAYGLVCAAAMTTMCGGEPSWPCRARVVNFYHIYYHRPSRDERAGAEFSARWTSPKLSTSASQRTHTHAHTRTHAHHRHSQVGLVVVDGMVRYD